MFVRQLYPPEGKCILGNGGYPCLAAPMRLTPYCEPVQAQFNQKHSHAHTHVVACCAILHNICLVDGDLVDEDVLEPADEDNGFPGFAEIISGDALRDTMFAAVAAPEVAVPALREHDNS